MACQGFPECSVACGCDTEPDRTVCAHCYEDVAESECIEAAGFLFCSTFCAVALVTFGHGENCRAACCSDRAPLTLPPMLCALCDDIFEGGGTEHPACRDKRSNAYGYQAAARGSVGAAS